MTSTLIIGLIFLGILLIFLIVSFFVKSKLEPSQYNTLHFLTSLCAGFAGGFITGDALLKIDATMANGMKIALSGTAGFAMFFLIWFTYPKRTPPPLENAYNISIPNGWTFKQTIDAIAQSNNSIATYQGFSTEEFGILLTEYVLNEESPINAIKKLKQINQSLPSYSVQFENNTFKIKKI